MGCIHIQIFFYYHQMRNSANLGGVFNLIGLAETEGEVRVKGGNGMLIWGEKPTLSQMVWFVFQTPSDLSVKGKTL